MRSVWLIGAVIAFVIRLIDPAFAERRVALAIGNGDYKTAGTLVNPVRDATAMAELFRKAGFEEVRAVSNVTAIDRVNIALKSLAFWESNCRINAVQAATDSQTVNGSCSGGGEKWREVFRFQMDGDRMIMKSDRDKFRSSRKYVRCKIRGRRTICSGPLN